MSFRISKKLFSDPKSSNPSKNYPMVLYSRFGTKSYFYRPKIHSSQKFNANTPQQFQQSLSPIKKVPLDKDKMMAATTAKKDDSFEKIDEKQMQEEDITMKQRQIYEYVKDLLQNPIPHIINKDQSNQKEMIGGIFQVVARPKTKKISKEMNYHMKTDRFNHKIYYKRKWPKKIQGQ